MLWRVTITYGDLVRQYSTSAIDSFGAVEQVVKMAASDVKNAIYMLQITYIQVERIQ